MNTIRRFATWSACLLPLVLPGCSPTGESVEEPVLVQGGGDAITLWTENVELFFEYPPLVAGAPGEPWAIHLTTMDDFQPVSQGTLTLRFEGSGGTTFTDVAEAPARPGIYTNAPSFSSPGMFDLVVEYRGQGLEEEIFVGPVQVFASENDLPMLPEEEHVGISFLKEQQWPIDFATAQAGPRRVAPGVKANGEIRGASDGLAEITAPVEGIIAWEQNRGAPAEGAHVARGDPMVTLSPVGGDDTYAVLASRAELLRREVARTERLVEAEAIPARRLQEARLELDVVQAQLQALGAPMEAGFTLILRSPISGAVTGRHFSVGQRVSAGAPLFTVLDPRRLWVRFHVPAAYASRLDGISAATYSPEGSDRVFRTDRLLTVESALDPMRRTVGVTFETENPDGALKPGMLIQGRILLAEREADLAVPAEAITDENGILVVYVQIGGETFERRAVTVGDTDGQWTTILSGVRTGEYVVTRGAYQVRLASLNTSELSDHGHVH